MQPVRFTAVDLPGLQRLAKEICERFPSELTIGLIGTLGAGKTTFAQAIAAGIGVDPQDVTSPTFTLLCSYRGRIGSGPITLHHLDAYRLADEDEFLELGVEELFETPRTWVLVEWADRVAELMPAGTLWITLEPETVAAGAEPLRTITIKAATEQQQTALRQLSTPPETDFSG